MIIGLGVDVDTDPGGPFVSWKDGPHTVLKKCCAIVS
uniref:Uncharacterized protein n=1 Tax=Anguilla anguilla TaxID=7936 RepID=A0A0E9WP74_ANGAN